MLTVEKNIGALQEIAFQQTMRPMRERNLRRPRQMNPFSARPRLRVLPTKVEQVRQDRLAEVQSECSTNGLGCWLYHRIREEAFPYIDLKGNQGEREQWSARRYVWALKHGEIPERGILLGGCPYTACVNPDHQALWVPPVQLDWVGAK